MKTQKDSSLLNQLYYQAPSHPNLAQDPPHPYFWKNNNGMLHQALGGAVILFSLQHFIGEGIIVPILWRIGKVNFTWQPPAPE